MQMGLTALIQAHLMSAKDLSSPFFLNALKTSEIKEVKCKTTAK